MKKEFRRHLQKFCDISNWSRMHHPKNGKENYEKGKALAEDILRLLFSREPGYDGLATALTAMAMVRSYVRKAICWTPAHDMDAEAHLMETYEELFRGDWWMSFRDDTIQSQLECFIRGDVYPYCDVLHLYDKESN